MIPVVPHHVPRRCADFDDRVERVATRLRSDHPELAPREDLRSMVVEHLDDAPSLHIDDHSETRYFSPNIDSSILQERARLRAGSGDYVVTCTEPTHEWAQYYTQYLRLGSPTWLRATPNAHGHHLAFTCWNDRSVRRELVRAVRQNGLLYIHPHMGTAAVWELARLLRQSSRRPLQVIAPPPGVTEFVNDKLKFADAAAQLLGDDFIPETHHAFNLAALSRLVHDCAASSRSVVVKLPDSAGAGGTVVLESSLFRDRTLATIRKILASRFSNLLWQGDSPLLVGSWETNVLCSPSAQLWIPPWEQGVPVVEGVFEQLQSGLEGKFIGSYPAALPNGIEQLIVDECWLLAALFQRLGYVGRCSFDMLLVGESLSSSRLKFLECNGRWGGTSSPMTLMNRLFGDWGGMPYCATEISIDGLINVSLATVIAAFSSEIYDARTDLGRLILYNGDRLQRASTLNVLALGTTIEEARDFLHSSVEPKLRELAGGAALTS